MAIKVFIQLDGSSATYKVEHEIDGIYKAVLAGKALHLSYLYPEKIILIRLDGQWTSDCPFKIIGLKIGQKVNEHERSS